MYRVRPIIGVLLVWVVRAFAASWRVRVIEEHHLLASGRGPVVFAFWHGHQMGLLAPKRERELVTLVSWSRDGALQASVMRGLGIRVVRGSSSRGASAGLRGMLRAVQTGADAAFAVDGPRGPRGLAKSGALVIADKSGAPLIPVAVAARHRLVLRRSWDSFEIPLPFTRVVVAIGAPVEGHCNGQGNTALADAIEQARQSALRALG